MVRGSIVVWLVLAIGGYAFAADPDHRHAVAYLRVMSTAGTGSAALTEPESEGSGLLIDRKQGIIVTSQSIINSLPGSSGDIFVSWSKTATPVRATLHACAYNLCLIRISPGDVPSTDRIADNDIPELACRKMNREHLQEHVVVTGYLPGEDYRVHEVQGNVTTDDPGPESNYPASIAFVDRLVPGSPVFDDDGYAVGVFDGRQAFKPLYLLNATFLSNNVLCENLPPRLERLVPYITGSQDRNLQQKLLQDQLPTQLPDWSGVKVWELLTRLRLRPTRCIECPPHSGRHGSLIGAFHTTVKSPLGSPIGSRLLSGTSPLQGTHRLALRRQQSGNFA
jgi:hypothetical protein